MIIGDLATPEACLPILANGNTSVRLDEADPTDPNQLSCMEAQLVVDEDSIQAVRGAYDGAARWVDAELGLLLLVGGGVRVEGGGATIGGVAARASERPRTRRRARS